jgi:hypothetical protein
VCVDVLGQCRHIATGVANRPYVKAAVRDAEVEMALGASAGRYAFVLAGCDGLRWDYCMGAWYVCADQPASPHAGINSALCHADTATAAIAQEAVHKMLKKANPALQHTENPQMFGSAAAFNTVKARVKCRPSCHNCVLHGSLLCAW